jgi:hypothetical protein
LCLEIQGCRFAPELVTTNHDTWSTSWGWQCYDHLGRICAVLTFHKKAVDNCPVERVLEKLTFAHLVKKFPALLEK